jgi:hypothetical protein
MPELKKSMSIIPDLSDLLLERVSVTNEVTITSEGQVIKERGTELGWAWAMLYYAITYCRVIPPMMTANDLEEVLYDLFPRKAITERGDVAEIIQELGAFWHFLERVYQLSQAKQLPACLTPQAARRLERALQEPANFGLAKSFVLIGKEAGCDMESPGGMRAWVEANNATMAPRMAAASRHPRPSTKKQSRGVPKGTRNAPPRKQKRTPPQ